MQSVFKAIFAKASTTVDGGWNVTFSVDSSEAQAIMDLAAMRDNVLQVAVIPIKGDSEWLDRLKDST